MKFTKVIKSNKQIEAMNMNDLILKCIQDIQILTKDFKSLDHNMYKLDIYNIDEKLDKYETGIDDISYSLTDTIDYIIEDKNLLKKLKILARLSNK